MPPACASKVPAPTFTPVERPSLIAHSDDRLPTSVSHVYVLLKSLSLRPVRTGSSIERNFSSGKPLKYSCHMALCPAAQRLLLLFAQDLQYNQEDAGETG